MRYLAIGTILLSLISCSERELGTKERPFTMYFVPSVDQETIATSAKVITDFVEKKVSQGLYGKESGFHIKSAIPTSYVAVVEAFGTEKADFAALNTFSYILARDIKDYDVEAVLSVVRGHNETSYKGQIIARVDSGIKKLSDLNGRKFAFTDPASTAGFIMPTRLFKEKGVELGQTVFAQKHDNVVTMIYQGQVEAGATYYSPPEGQRIRDARARVKTQFPDVEEKVKIVGFTEEIPNDPWVMRKSLYPNAEKNTKVRKLVVDALEEFAKIDEGKKALKELYNITGLTSADDSKYQKIRQMIKDSNLNIEQVLNKKAQKKKKKS